MTMVLNHYFTLVDKSYPQKEELINRGFKFLGPKSHKGQGTSAEFVLFPKSYFEFIWIDDEDASKGNILKLYKRNKKDTCKYGLCFAGAIPEEIKEDFILYIPPYSPKTRIMVLKESIDDLSMPLIFLSANSEDPSDSEPQSNKNIPEEVFNPQDKFFIPEDLKNFNIPDFFRSLI